MGLLRNGDFSDGLAGWQFAAKRTVAQYPSFAVLTVFGSRAAAIDVGSGADGYIEQEVTLPAGSSYELTFKVGRAAAVRDVSAYFSIVDSSDIPVELARFSPACARDIAGSPEAKGFDLSLYAGLTIKIRLGATTSASGPERTVYVSDIALRARALNSPRPSLPPTFTDDYDGCAAGATALFAVALSGTIDRGDVDFFRFNASANQLYAVSVHANTLLSAAITLYRPDGTVAATATAAAGQTAEVRVTSPAATTFFVSIRGGASDQIGSYSVSLVGLTAAASASPRPSPSTTAAASASPAPSPTPSRTPTPTATPTSAPSPTPTPAPVDCTADPAQRGSQTYFFFGGSGLAPVTITVDPQDARLGQSQSIGITTDAPEPVSSVVVREIIDGTRSAPLSLALTSGTAQGGSWTGSWNVPLNVCTHYQLEFVVTGASGATSGPVTLTITLRN